ncbi:MAG: hypothetical protein J5982_03285 [Bacilli bacterium]|nr:hypothetical protein [Bacilli bacterium]
MASSGSFQTNKYGGVRGLQFNWWVSSQDISGNYTDIGWNYVGYGSNSSTWYYTKNAYLNINGSRVFTQNSTKIQLKVGTVIASGTTRIYHNSDGSKSFGADGGATIYNYSTYQTGSGSWTLPTIPRASSITSSADYTKGDAVTVTVSRASGNFSHTIEFLVDSQVIKTITGVGTSCTWTPTKSELETMLKKGTGSVIRCYTYNGGTHIGTSTKSGTASNPSSSKITNDFSFTVGNSTKFQINRNKNYYSHSLEISVAGKLIKTISSVGTEVSWTPNSSELTAIYNAMGSTAKATISVKCITYARGATIGNTIKTGDIIISSTNNNPTFSGWSYQNNNSISNNVLGTNQVVLQNYNSIVITCNQATAKNQASITKYQAIVNGSVYETTDLTKRKITLPNLNLSGDVIIQVRAIDSRGFMTTVEKHLTFIPYTKPVLNTINLKRRNNYGEETTMELSGVISLINYNGFSKNKVKTFKYRYKNVEGGSYSSWIDITKSTIPNTSEKYSYNSSTGKLTLKEVEIGNFETKATYVFEFIIEDSVTSTPVTTNLKNGIPLLAYRKKKLGVNCVPDKDGKDGLYLNGNYVPYEESVFDNSSGSTGNIIPETSLKDSEYVLIEFKANDILGSVRIDNPINKVASLVIVDASTATLYVKNITIKEKEITVNSYNKVVLNSSKTSSNDIKIIKIIKGN